MYGHLKCILRLETPWQDRDAPITDNPKRYSHCSKMYCHRFKFHPSWPGFQYQPVFAFEKISNNQTMWWACINIQCNKQVIDEVVFSSSCWIDFLKERNKYLHKHNHHRGPVIQHGLTITSMSWLCFWFCLESSVSFWLWFHPQLNLTQPHQWSLCCIECWCELIT